MARTTSGLGKSVVPLDVDSRAAAADDGMRM
jgi:hypothetical protein